MIHEISNKPVTVKTLNFPHNITSGKLGDATQGINLHSMQSRSAQSNEKF